MEGSGVESVSDGLPPVNQLYNSTSNVEQEEQISDSSADEADKCSQTKDEVQLESELIKTMTDVQIDIDTQTYSQEQVEGSELAADNSCDSSTVSIEDKKPSFCLLNEADGASVAPVTTLDNVVESSPSVLEGTIETLLTFDEIKDSNATTQNSNEQPSVLGTNCSTEPSPADDSEFVKSPSSSSVQCPSKNSPTDSTTSGISNGPSSPSSDTISSSLASSPQTSANTSAPSHSSSSPYDTDCSRKLISQIQRSLSQESLLDELESELLACQLPESESEGGQKGRTPVNGLPTDQDGCMVVFEKCVQYKYGQQEKAIQR
ncbi:hypothetical protein PAMP_010301 [Pampus punctatissimus]